MQLAGNPESIRPLGRWRLRLGALALLLIGLALLLPAAVSASSVGDVPCAVPGDPPRNVVAVGDSITMQLTDALHWDFALSKDPISVQGHCGYRIDQLRPYLQYDAAGLPNLRQVFFFGGTNDAWTYKNNPSWQLKWSINELHAAVHDVIDKRPRACMFLVTMRATTAFGQRYADMSYAINNHIQSLASAFPRVYMIDWAAVVRQHPEYLKDFIGHVTEEGARVLASMYWYMHNAYAQSCR